MHELGVTQRILEATLARAAESGACRITDIHLEAGDDSGIDMDAIALHWPIVSAGTIAAGATIHVDPSPVPHLFRLVALDADGVAGPESGRPVG